VTPALTVFFAEGCHLCEPAKATVHAVAAPLGVPVEEVDITGVPELEARYRTSIPVVELDGRRIAKYVVDAADLERRLRRRIDG
jgi:thiol-disulfide isomerase/thioredoxin